MKVLLGRAGDARSTGALGFQSSAESPLGEGGVYQDAALDYTGFSRRFPPLLLPIASRVQEKVFRKSDIKGSRRAPPKWPTNSSIPSRSQPP